MVIMNRMEYPTDYEIGVDEVGRGCFYGPVVAAAVVLPLEMPQDQWTMIRDSKKLSEKKRQMLADFIKENALYYGIAEATVEEIDTINILQASLKAMHRAIHSAYTEHRRKSIPCFKHIFVDGNHFKPYLPPGEDSEYIPYTCIEQGDNKKMNIAAASILAKTYRDQWIQDICEKNPILKEYDMHNNKGYGTKKHMEALKERGPIEGHRMTFKPVREAMKKHSNH